MDVGSSEKAIDDSLKENNNNDHFAKETDPNLPNQDQFAQELNPNLPNEDRFAKETNPNLPNASDFMSDALLFQNDDNFHSNPLNETKEETEPQSFLGESTVSDAFGELYSSNGALEAAYEEMQNELMGDFDMDFVGPTHGSNAIDENNNINNDNNDMGGNIYVDQEVNLLDAPKETLNEMPSQEKALNNTTASFETEKTEFQFPLKKDEEDQNNEEKKSPLNGDLRDGNEEVDITDKPQNNNIICENIYTDQEASLLNAPKITNETENDTPSQEKTRTNEEDQKNEDRIKNSPFNENNNDDHEEEEEEEEIDIMDSNENGSQNEETLKGSPINNNNSNNSNNNNNDEEEEELVDIMDSNENDSQNVKSPSIEEEEDDRYEDTLELQIPQSVQALNAGPSPPNTSRSHSIDKSDDHRRKGRKRSKSKSRSRSRSRSRERERERERQRGKSRRQSTTRDRDRRVSRSPAGRRRRRVRSRSPISLRDLRRGGSPRLRSPIRRRRRSPPPRRSLRRRPSPPPVRRRRSPSPPPVRWSTGFGRPGKNLYVTGFSFDTTVDDLETKFSKFGSVSGTRIVRDRLGESKGFGFLSMDTDLEADEAIRALDGKVWNNKVLVVEKTKSSQRS